MESLPEKQTLAQNPKSSGETAGIYEGVTAVEEYVDMPESFAQEAGSDNELGSNDTSAIEMQAHKEEVPRAHENLSTKDELKLRVLGGIAVAPSIVWFGAKQRFNSLAVRLHAWAHSTKAEESPQVSPVPVPAKAKETHNFVSAAAEAKTAGDWMAYQKELLEFADTAEQNQTEGSLSDEALSSRIRRADKKLAGVEDGRTEKVELELPESKQVNRKQEWLDPRNVLSLKNAIDEEVSKNPDKRQEIVTRLHEEYFGAYLDDLKEGKEVPLDIQKYVASMLDMPKHELKVLAENAKAGKLPENVISLEEKRKEKQSKSEQYDPFKPTVRVTTPASLKEQEIEAEQEKIESPEKSSRVA